MPDEQDPTESAKPKKKRMLTILVVVGTLLVEGVLIVGLMKLLGAAPAATVAGEVEPEGGGLNADSGAAAGDLAEVVIAETDAFNNRSGRLCMYHMQITALVKASNSKVLEKLVEQRGATIRDRINTVIRRADPKHLDEPGLETLRRQVKFELDKIVRDDSLILELLIPELLQSRAGL